ncbi:HPr-rel-A system PqqD family peptide chaperone [Rubrivivax gelatinosus]|uniref:HPr-rel-A system PqqD family peptide chaperone n=1 Tax=Rubrivivax gelatinosus TaxID=28068 RepID=UPI0005C22CCF|nr:HPr-rel-A system PqqD family peptide chaperone [Rubrivivax gelatinosus]MBG6080364.1 PqqD family protein of HPr-rel-A system [Rubrivivax gelatinosus]
MTRPLWSLTREPAIYVRSWDDSESALVFDERSGDTFTLGSLALELMLMLDEVGSQPAEALVAALAAQLDAAAPADLAGLVAVELERLRTRGIAAPQDS